MPGRHFDIVTFEVKHHNAMNVTAVYEALAHRRSATRAYVLLYVPDMAADASDATMAEITEEASRHGINASAASQPINGS